MKRPTKFVFSESAFQQNLSYNCPYKSTEKPAQFHIPGTAESEKYVKGQPTYSSPHCEIKQWNRVLHGKGHAFQFVPASDFSSLSYQHMKQK